MTPEARKTDHDPDRPEHPPTGRLRHVRNIHADTGYGDDTCSCAAEPRWRDLADQPHGQPDERPGDSEAADAPA